MEKENPDMAKREIALVEEQIKSLAPTEVLIGGRVYSISHILLLTMVDGKICNTLTETSSQRCYVCKAIPKEMNNINLAHVSEDPSTFRFGLSVLHVWIRCFECLLHISYRLHFKKWQVRDPDKETLLVRKQKIIKRFKKELGLRVDQPNAGGSGNSNNVNTARRFFASPEMSSEITGIILDLIKRFAIILHTISTSYEINIAKFGKFAFDTARLYIKLYPWYFMPATVHKLLIHGEKIIEHAILPIGQLAEDALEARHRDLRRYRLGHASKCSRKKNLEDVLTCFLCHQIL